MLRADWDGVIPMTRPEPGRGPRPARRGQHPRLAGPGRRVDHRDAPAVGQHRQRGRGLIHAQPGPRARTVRVLRAAGQRAVELRQVRAERPRGLGAVHARRAARRAPARPCAVPWSAARAWRTARRRAAGRRCARRRAASWPAPRPAPAPPGRPPARTPTRSARSARSSSSAAAAAGSMPDRGSTRPRYLIRSARVQVLLSCCASATAFCAARRTSSWLGTGPGSPGPRVRARVPAAVVPHRRRDRRQAHAESARELVRPARVHLRDIQRAVLGGARGEVRRLREPRQLALRRRAAVVLLEPRRAGTQVGGDGLAAGGEQPHHLPARCP